MLWLALLIACGTTPDDDPAPEDTPAVQNDAIPLNLQPSPAVDAAMNLSLDAGLVGIGVGIAQGGEIVFLGGYGFEDREAGIAVDPEQTMFRWASVSKGLVGVTAVKGAVDLDADVSVLVEEYNTPTSVLPADCYQRSCALDLPADQRTVSLRMLLSHAGGAPHYGNGTTYPVPSAADANNPAVNTGMAWALPLWIDEPLVSIPGTKHNYSTFGYNLAGVSVERARGESLAALVNTDVSEPAGMTTMQPDYQWVDIDHRAQGYLRSGGEVVLQELDQDVSWKLAGGGFISSVADFTRYCAALNSGLLLPAETRDAELWRIQYPDLKGYALGFSISETAFGRRAAHTGAQDKTRTALAAYEDGLCVVVMTNSEWASPSTLRASIEAAWRAEH